MAEFLAKVVNQEETYETAQRQARAALQDLWETRAGVLSTQVLEEFYVNVTRKVPRPLARREARDLVRTEDFRHGRPFGEVVIRNPFL